MCCGMGREVFVDDGAALRFAEILLKLNAAIRAGAKADTPGCCRKLLLPSDPWQLQLHEPGWIQRRPLPADGHVEMGTGDSSRAAAQSDGLAPLHMVALFHFEFGQMQIEGEQALAVVEHHAIPLEIERPSEQNRAVIHGCDGSPAVDAEIQSQVW